MKLRKNIITISIITAIVVIVAVRLVANKNSFDKELAMVSESNTSIPVITDSVKFRQIAGGFSVNGNFSPLQEISITAETQGKIISLHSENGDKVVTGQVLASIDNEIYASQLELAKFNLEKAEKDLQRNEQLSKNDGVTMQQCELSKQTVVDARSAYVAAKNQYENSFIKAPFDGIITKRYVEKGSFLAPGAAVFDMVKISKVKLIVKLTAEETKGISKTQKVKVMVEAYPEATYEGTVSAIVVKADLSKLFDVEIEVENRTNKLIKPGMYGMALFTDNSNKLTLIIPRQAIAGSIKNPEIFIVKGDSVVSQKIVVTPLDDKYVEVNEGLKAGDIIVISGQINLVNGSKIKLF